MIRSYYPLASRFIEEVTLSLLSPFVGVAEQRPKTVFEQRGLSNHVFVYLSFSSTTILQDGTVFISLSRYGRFVSANL